MGKRTKIDFSKHKLIVKEDSLCKIHWLKLPETSAYNVKFIHVEGLLLVTGDFGRWSFCRDFNPEGFDESGVSDSYWCEKIEIGSKQCTEIFDSETAEQSIRENIKNLEAEAEKDEDGNFDDEREQEEYDFWNDLLGFCNNDFELTNYFRDNKPDSLDFECFPHCKKQHHYLDAVFDAFEEVIKRF